MTVTSSKPADSVRVAGIDCGTNSIRLLIADVTATGMRVVVPKTMEVVRLGQGIDRTHRFDPAALERTLAACAQFARLIEQNQVDTVRFVATSATRDADNRAEFEDAVERILAVRPEVISGTQEAALSFLGASAAAQPQSAQPCLVVDLGGGSTELVLGTSRQPSAVSAQPAGLADQPTRPSAGQAIVASFSMDIGSVRMSERHLHSDPPTTAEIKAALEDIDQHIDQALNVVPLGQTASLVGVSGTVTTMSLLALGEREYSRDKVDGATVSFTAAQAACDRLIHLNRSQLAQIPLIHPGRRDVIAGGALIWSRVLARLAERVPVDGRQIDSYTASERGLLDGLVLDRGQGLLGL